MPYRIMLWGLAYRSVGSFEAGRDDMRCAPGRDIGAAPQPNFGFWEEAVLWGWPNSKYYRHGGPHVDPTTRNTAQGSISSNYCSGFFSHVPKRKNIELVWKSVILKNGEICEGGCPGRIRNLKMGIGAHSEFTRAHYAQLVSAWLWLFTQRASCVRFFSSHKIHYDYDYDFFS